ncbi:hypothetical protein HXX76_006687 [Chlamydomonas incerta]|uniref:Uncharacterized protein n=1 Tax=Chlamydomonas incerta TaxID=51695 RepID=A0A835TCL0_CHLIN|nr:hypothetical protein HXX76_006687 [Chlamydomonas incerta]|eukprot:KAG2436380.1 hypothetical protein HXX76_006687 [Chlamydomonas incerta]
MSATTATAPKLDSATTSSSPAVSPAAGVVSNLVESLTALGVTLISPLLLLFIAALSVFRGIRNYGRTEMGWRS